MPVGIFIVIRWLPARPFAHVHSPHGQERSRKPLLPRFAPVDARSAGHVVLIFAFQADNITGKPFHVVFDRDSDSSAWFTSIRRSRMG